MLLTDEEIAAIHEADDGSRAWGSYRAIEAAILAKLASAELPEPVGAYEKVVGTEIWQGFPSEIVEMQDAYTADQLRQAYAQGAAAQLAEKPIAWANRDALDELLANVFTGITVGFETDWRDVPLYTRRQA